MAQGNQDFLTSDRKMKAVPENDGSDQTKAAAVKLQKVYRSYRTRRRLADSAVVAEELWWQAIDYARLNHSTASFYNFSKPETAASRWTRVSLNASKIDPRHRYGHNLKVYYEEWSKRDAGQPFFYWLDIGEGKEIDLIECPRSKLRQECIRYLGPQEREHYECIIAEGIVVHKQTGDLLDTNDEVQGSSRWIFVMSTMKQLYVGRKSRGLFHHSSFLAGGATLAAGRLTAERGKIKSVSAYSGHYRPTEDNLDSFLCFLKDNGVQLEEVQVISHSEDYRNYGPTNRLDQKGSEFGLSTCSEHHQLEVTNNTERNQAPQNNKLVKTKRAGIYSRTLSTNLPSPNTKIPEKEILQRIKSKKEAASYQLGHQLSLKWSTGAGPRIGCVADYPQNLRAQALEFVNLSFKESPPEPAYGYIQHILHLKYEPYTFHNESPGVRLPFHPFDQY